MAFTSDTSSALPYKPDFGGGSTYKSVQPMDLIEFMFQIPRNCPRPYRRVDIPGNFLLVFTLNPI